MSSPVSPESLAAAARGPVNILIVDDEVRNLEVLEIVLTSPEYHLVRAQTAQEALMALLEGEFAVLVLDIQMPGTNGIELAHLIKQRKRTQHVPIIFLTAYFQEDRDILHGYEVGAVDYLTKPIDPKILKSKIAVYVELFRKTRELSAVNSAMESEIAQRQKAELALRQTNNELEARVQERVAAHADLMRQKEAQMRLFDATLSSITDLAYTFDLEGNWIYANKPLLELWGKPLHEIAGKSSLELGYPPELAGRLKQQVKEVIETRKPIKGETYYTSASGVEDYHEYIFSPVFGTDGRVVAVCGTTRLTTERKRAEAAAENQRRVLQLIAEDASLAEVLDALIRTVELQSSGRVFASILLLDAEGTHLRHGAAPSLPPAFTKAFDGVRIGPAVGSCGTAACLKQPIYVSDIATDPLWADYKDLALANGLRACWSVPIYSSDGDVLGTFAMYHPEPRQAIEKDLQIVEMATRTASIAIERKLSDAVVRESERRYSQLVHGLPAAVYTTDAQGHVTLFNEAAVALWGRTPEVGKDLWCGSYRIYRPDGTPLPMNECPMAVTLREGRPVRGQEIIVERPDGVRRNVLPYPDPIRDASGRIVGAVNMLLDVTDRKRAEAALRRLASIVESSADAIVSKDLHSIVTTWNHGAEMLFGYKAEEMVGQPITLLMPPDRLNEEPNILERICRGEQIEHYETIRQRKDGTLMDISLTVSPLMDEHGKIVGASKIIRDITGQKQAKRDLERAHKDVLAASRAKDDFLAALSHELRTPLNPVLLLASEAAEDPQLSDEVRSQFATIRNNVELEARLIDDLLDITRITHGKLMLNLEQVDVHAVLRESLETVRPELEEKGIQLTLELEADQPLVNGDAVRLQQVFWNVIKNAIKFTGRNGQVAIQTRTRASTGELIITVADDGIGMTDAELSRIFNAFSQGEHAVPGGSHRFGGLGLGLAISRMLVECHSGSIRASSEGRDQGSTFVITLPLLLDAVPAASAPKDGDGDLRKRNVRARQLGTIHVLLVEDHEPTRTALAHLLTRRHYGVQTAASVAEARALSGKQQFQLLISDIGLPDGNGFELMKELQASNKDLQGIALTGYGMEQDIARSHEAGFLVHLTKPVRVQFLEAALAAAVPQ